jgi:homoserine O-acetyltransferase
MHGTGGSGRSFLSAGFGGELFGKGQPLDIAHYYIILPDGIGHGKSSKPSDGMHMKFPHYTYDDMVKADYLLVHDGPRRPECGPCSPGNGNFHGGHAYLGMG